MMTFEPLYYSDRLHLINPQGDVGITTLWSPVPQVLKWLEEREIDLSPSSSRIVVVANLYGNGLPQMLRNLLWNPQIVHIVVLGQNLSGSREELVNFFQWGLEPVEYLGISTYRIVGTQRIIDGKIQPTDFKNGIQIYPFGKLSDVLTKTGVAELFHRLPPPYPCLQERVQVTLPKPEVQRFPSEPRQHNILRDTPLTAWQELIFRLVRFGYPVQLKKGQRIELQNVKVIITQPLEESEELLQNYGFSWSHFKTYQQRILSPELLEHSYTYGHRMRGYFCYQGQVVDSLAIVIQRLQADPQSRHAYISLWDNHRDLPEGRGCPCLVSIFFRYFDGQLTLTATFRTHNAMDAWLENVYGLMAIQNYVANSVGMRIGAITVFSHSISLSGEVLDKAKMIAANKTTDEVINPVTSKREPRYDYHGNFAVTIDENSQELVVQHTYQGAVIAEYRGKSSEAIEQQLARDDAVSEIAHALYLGRELARKEWLLKMPRMPRN